MNKNDSMALLLRRRPEGLLRAGDVELVSRAVPTIGDGEALVRTEMLSIDATVRSWLSTAEGYLPPVELGDVVRCSSIGRVIESRCDAFSPGDVAYTLGGMAEHAVVRDDVFTTRMDPETDMATVLAVYGGNGLAAYVGTVEIGTPRPGETFVVSAAAGATGSLAGQIARIMGCRVVGIAGTDEKCRRVVDELGFDACINHRDADLGAALREQCPDRIDVYFDNVGGDVLDAVLGRLANGARVVLCGAISVYNDAVKPPGPANYLNLISRRARMEGFIAMDHWGRFDEIRGHLAEWIAQGRLTHFEYVVEGLDHAVDALNSLFTGANTGKVIVKVTP